MKIIDAHFHLAGIIAGYCRRGELRAAGNGKARWANGDEFQLIPEELGDINFSYESALKLMDAHGIEKAVLLQGSMYGFQNDYNYEAMTKYPDRFIGAATVDPFMTNYKEVLANLFDNKGFKVLKFEVSSGGGLMGCHEKFELDGERMMSIYEMAAERNVTVVLDIGDYHMESYQPQAIANFAKRFPDLKVVICHLLAPQHDGEEILKRDLAVLNLPNIWFDLAALPKITDPDEYPFPTALKAIKTAKEILGHKKLIWGTDTPFALTKDSYKVLTDYLFESDVFTETEKEDVFYNNAVDAYAKEC